MFEKRFAAVPPQFFTADGTASGLITIARDACILFKVKQKVILTANTLPNIELEIKEIDSNNNIYVGPKAGTLGAPNSNTGISARTDISAYTVALSAAIMADEQKRPAIDNIEIVRATYEEEPTTAVRSILVDPCGDLIGPENPLSVAFDGTVTIGDVSIVEGGNTMTVNPDGSINTINLAQLVPKEFNEIDLTNSVIAGQTVPTVVTYKLASVAVAVLTLTYDGSANLLSVVRT